jgi:hypothetical protein
MKKNLLLFLALSISTMLSAQTFSKSTSAAIPPNSVDLLIPVSVSGLPSTADAAFGIAKICFTIYHQYDADLKIWLQAPDGTRIMLADGVGGNGQNFYATCLSEDATDGTITGASAPFNGNYYPRQSLNLLNNSQDPNGTWYFIVRDVFAPTDTGFFQSVSITFTNNPPVDPAIASPCSETNAGACQCADSLSTNCDLLPDIQASALSIMDDNVEFPGYIEVGVATPNVGWGPLEIHGIDSCYCDTVLVSCTTDTCLNGEPPTQLVNQRIYHKNGNTMTYYDRPAGTMSYHPLHSHIHVDDWVYNSVRTQTPDPDPRNWPIIGAGTKISFCLVNYFSCDTHYGYCQDSLGNYMNVADFPNAGFGNVSGCTTDQGIYVGYVDEYNSYLPGQEIYIPEACNDTYYIVSIIDPLNRFSESKEDNNWTAVPITLTMQNAGSLETAGFGFSINNNQVDFQANATSADSCVWFWGDATSTTSASPLAQHIYSQIGTYIVYLYAYNHCGPRVSIDTVHIQSITGLPQNENSIVSFDAFPNPSNDKINFSYTLINSDDITLEIYDAIGNKVKSLSMEKQNPGKYKILLDAKSENLPKGIYVAKLSSSKENNTIGVIIM